MFKSVLDLIQRGIADLGSLGRKGIAERSKTCVQKCSGLDSKCSGLDSKRYRGFELTKAERYCGLVQNLSLKVFWLRNMPEIRIPDFVQ